jgi:hypothetical protein
LYEAGLERGGLTNVRIRLVVGVFFAPVIWVAVPPVVCDVLCRFSELLERLTGDFGVAFGEFESDVPNTLHNSSVGVHILKYI